MRNGRLVDECRPIGEDPDAAIDDLDAYGHEWNLDRDGDVFLCLLGRYDDEPEDYPRYLVQFCPEGSGYELVGADDFDQAVRAFNLFLPAAQAMLVIEREQMEAMRAKRSAN
jgi:hypothetical protein